MELSDDVLCVFSAQIGGQNGSYHINIPDRELTLGDLEPGSSYRIAILSSDSAQTTATEARRSTHERTASKPPVEVGDQRTVDIENIGEQGDGIARVERGYVVVVPETELNERVTIEITRVTETVAFGEVLEREEYYQ
ncbi:TRAM domain-containing protein [Halalkalicoccus salilacus]|uniref:TRAM domain-containing protein n=1 Tax=Halalkalicoccus salilacus TaxID=3117459 RepID=UPI00300E705E